jgi:hypothetical protein
LPRRVQGPGQPAKKPCISEPTKKNFAPIIAKFIGSHLELEGAMIGQLTVEGQGGKESSMPSLLDVSEVGRSTVFVTDMLKSKLGNGEVRGSYGPDGVYEGLEIKSGLSEGRELCGECVQEMMDPGRTQGCYFTVEKYKNPDNMIRGFATLDQIGVMPHAHAEPVIYIVSSNVTFCGLDRNGQYATVNLRAGTLVLISGGATHGLYKNWGDEIEKFINHFYWCFPKPSDCISYVACGEDKDFPVQTDVFGFKGVTFFNLED